jgi:hypothetical protein
MVAAVEDGQVSQQGSGDLARAGRLLPARGQVVPLDLDAVPRRGQRVPDEGRDPGVAGNRAITLAASALVRPV